MPEKTTNQAGVILKFPEKVKELDEFIKGLLEKDSSVPAKGHLIESLHKAQELFGYLPIEVQSHVAMALGLHLTEVYGVVSFYSFFTDLPQGKYKINVCTGTACFVKGSGKIMEEFSRYIGIEEGNTSDDLKFSLNGLRCVGACSFAPVVLVNDRVYGNVTPKMVPEIIEDCV
jgi:NADH:ubiquinone oxidoreductase subunit E